MEKKLKILSGGKLAKVTDFLDYLISTQTIIRAYWIDDDPEIDGEAYCIAVTGYVEMGDDPVVFFRSAETDEAYCFSGGRFSEIFLNVYGFEVYSNDQEEIH